MDEEVIGKWSQGLMPMRLAETFEERLEYCRILLKVNGFLTCIQSEQMKEDIKDHKWRRGNGNKKETA